MASNEEPTYLENDFTMGGIYMQGSFSEEGITATKNLKTLDDDVFLLSYPRTGTTWTQNIILGLVDGAEKLKEATYTKLLETFPFAEIFTGDCYGNDIIDKQTGKRFIKSHLPVQLATNEIFTKNRKCVLILRNPKDTSVSLNSFVKKMRSLGPQATKTYSEFFEKFMTHRVFYGDWWDWTKGWLDAAKDKDNIIVIHYEDLQADFITEARKLGKFLGVDISDEKLEAVAAATNVDVAKARYAKAADGHSFDEFIRSGKAHAYMSTMSQEEANKMDEKTKKVFEGYECLQKFL